MKLIDLLYKAGFRGEGLKMAYAIAMAESRGDAHARNSVGNSAGVDRGLFQINSYYHSEVSDAQAYDALANAKAAFRISNGGKNWSQWSTFLNKSYKQFLGGSGAGVKNTSGSFSASDAGDLGVATPSLTDSERAEQYGFSMRLINSNKELKNLFKQAVSGSWSAARFVASVKNTKWWRTQSNTLRQYVILQITDPATWKQNRSNAQAKITSLAAQVGLDVKHLPKGLMSDAIYNDLAMGWDDARLKDWLGTKVKLSGGYMLGEAGDNFDKLHELAYSNGVKYSASWYESQARAIVSGKSALQNAENTIRKQAAATYKAFAPQINAGMNVLDLAAPYIQSMSQVLELPQTDLDLFDKHIHDAMAGGTAEEATPLWQFENDLRNDPRWRQTNNARESMFGVAHQVAKDFGLAF